MPLDYNPEASANLRSKSIEQNLKESLAKQAEHNQSAAHYIEKLVIVRSLPACGLQAELKKRDKKQKREDLCEMLGRGC